MYARYSAAQPVQASLPVHEINVQLSSEIQNNFSLSPASFDIVRQGAHFVAQERETHTHTSLIIE